MHVINQASDEVWWTRNGCLPFKKQPLEKKLIQDGGGEKKKKVVQRDCE